MKSSHGHKTHLKLVGFILASATVALPAVADPAIVQEAQKLCIEDAQAKGFALKTIVSAGEADVPGKDAKIVLTLIKSGQDYKQTCYYDKNARSVSFGDEIAPASTPRAPETTYSFAWWWVLLPLIGLPLLLMWAKNRRGSETVVGTTGAEDTVRYYDAIVRTPDGTPAQVYEDPSYSSRVLGTLRDGQSVRTTGRENDDWFELVGGGWLPKQYAATSTHP